MIARGGANSSRQTGSAVAQQLVRKPTIDGIHNPMQLGKGTEIGAEASSTA